MPCPEPGKMLKNSRFPRLGRVGVLQKIPSVTLLTGINFSSRLGFMILTFIWYKHEKNRIKFFKVSNNENVLTKDLNTISFKNFATKLHSSY